MAQNFVCIASFGMAHEAHLVRGLLESAGVPAILRNEHLVGINSFYSTAVGGVEVMVPAECVDDALHFLQGEVSAESMFVDSAKSATSIAGENTSEAEPPVTATEAVGAENTSEASAASSAGTAAEDTSETMLPVTVAEAGDAEEKECVSTCPHCGGRLAAYRRIWPAVLSFLLVFGAPPAVRDVQKCTACGKKVR